jgi:hypothetical protein
MKIPLKRLQPSGSVVLGALVIVVLEIVSDDSALEAVQALGQVE